MRSAALQDAERGSGDDDLGRRADVPADHGRPRPRALVRQPVGQIAGEAGRQARRGGEADEQGDRPGAHRGDVGEVLRRGLDPDVEPGRPVPAEVVALDQGVRRGDDRTGQVEDRCVVPRPHPDQRR